MSPEAALLIRAAFLGVLVFAVERFGKRRQERRTAARSTGSTIIRLPATRYPVAPPVTGQPLQVDVVRVVARPSSTAVTTPSKNGIVRLEPRTATGYIAEKRTLDGHVTEKHAA